MTDSKNGECFDTIQKNVHLWIVNVADDQSPTSLNMQINNDN